MNFASHLTKKPTTNPCGECPELGTQDQMTSFYIVVSTPAELILAKILLCEVTFSPHLYLCSPIFINSWVEKIPSSKTLKFATWSKKKKADRTGMWTCIKNVVKQMTFHFFYSTLAVKKYSREIIQGRTNKYNWSYSELVCPQFLVFFPLTLATPQIAFTSSFSSLWLLLKKNIY